MPAGPEDAVHTSAYDRLQGEQGRTIDSAAFDLVPVSREAAGKEIRETPVEELRAKRQAKKRNPTGRRVRRDEWVSIRHTGMYSAAASHVESF